MTAALLRDGRAPIRSRRILGDGGVKLDRFGLDGELEPLRHYADHRVRTAIQHQDAADHVIGVIEMALPKTITRDYFETAGSATRLLIRADKAATKHRLDAKHVEEFPAHFFSADALRSLFVHECEGAIAINRHAGKAAVLFAEIEEIRIAERVESGRRRGRVQINAAHGHEFLGRREWQRLQEHRVDHAEDGGVRTDAEREREHRDKGEAGMLDQLAYSVANVSHHMGTLVRLRWIGRSVARWQIMAPKARRMSSRAERTIHLARSVASYFIRRAKR